MRTGPRASEPPAPCRPPSAPGARRCASSAPAGIVRRSPRRWRRADSESRYWRARAANELALAAFKQLDALADSLERRAVRATMARAEERYTDAIVELNAALTFAPGNPALLYELASACYLARDYEQAVATLSPLLEARPDDPRLLELAGYSPAAAATGRRGGADAAARRRA